MREGRRLIERSLKRESEREGKKEGAGRVRVKMVKKKAKLRDKRTKEVKR